MDLISVIVPVYNVENYLGKCLDSIINQTYKNIEIIVVDDGSTDSSGRLCDEYAERDVRIKVIHKDNGGLSDARNAGLDICKGDYIGFIDSDDTIDTDMYETLYNNICKYNADVSMCKNKNIDETGPHLYIKDKGVKVYDDKLSILQELLLGKGLSVSVCVKLFRRKIFSDIRFEYGKFYEDVWAFWPIYEKTQRLVVDYIAKYNYFLRDGSICHQNKYSEKLLQRDEAYDVMRQKSIQYGKGIYEVVMYRVFWSYRETIFHIMCTDDWNEHRDEIRNIQRNIIRNLPQIMLNKYMSIKQKTATLLAGVNAEWFWRIKIGK